MCKKLFYLPVILLALAASTGVQAEVFIDDFNTPHDYITDGVEGTIWDDFFGLFPGETIESLNASIDREGQLFMSSQGGYWSNNDSPLGPFLFKVVEGDFIASVEITDYAGTAAAPVYHNDGGLMARAYLDDAGDGEDWVTIDYFPIWSCGNFLWMCDDGVRNEAWGCNNGKQWDSDRWLQLEREGNTFYFRTSTDGVNWTEISCSPKTRDDFDGLPLMVGLRHATYNTTLGYVAYDHFRLETIVKLKAYDPVPSDGVAGVISPLLEWTAGQTAAFHDVYFGTNPTPGEAEYQGRQALTTYSYAPGLIPGTTYYWRIDEVEADGTTINEGDVWSFTATSFTAWNPGPPDGAQGVLSDTDLSWSAGSTASRHDVYFGTDETAVANATTDSPEFKGNQSETTYEPGPLEKDKTYYWRIDEVEADRFMKHKGNVWSFKTLADISIYNPDLVGWWKLDGISYGTNVIDSSGYNRHGTSIGNPQWIAGYDGGALQFDGRDDYVELPIGSVIAELSSCTIMTWANFANSGGAWQHIFDFGNDPNVYMFLTPRIYFIDPMRFAITTDGGDAEVQVTAPDTLPSGWHNVAVTIDADTSIIALYLDDEEVATGTSALTPSDLGNTTNNWLGRSQYADDAYYMGALDDFRIYNYALTQDEIFEAMRGDPLLAWKPMPANTALTDIENALPLSWTPGEQAVQHDVYLVGTDESAVESADTSDTTGIYRGRQDPNNYTPPEDLEPNQVYYWRVDEVNTDETVSKGRIWSFTVADYLIVDDFEDYDDIDNRIYYTWGDYFVNSTGMTVGYFDPPYAEQTIVHGGSQAMYMHYDNDGTVNEGTSYEQSGTLLYSEAERSWEVAQDWTRKGVESLAIWFRGLPPIYGSFTEGPPITMTARGVDIWGTADQFHFAYKRLSGEGSITARVVSITDTDPWAKAGVMIRNSLDADSVHAIVVVTPGNGVAFEYRNAAGGASLEEALQADITAPQWVRLTRNGNNFTAEYSTNGTNDWQMLGVPITIPMSVDVYVGLCLTSHNVNETCTAEFSDVDIDGTVTGEWQSQDIGIESNIGEQLYVVLEDSAGNSAVVNNSDPAATTIDTWTEWNIPFTDFTGVNMQTIKKVSIGVGDRVNPQAGSAGDLYIDDIGLKLPKPVE